MAQENLPTRRGSLQLGLARVKDVADTMIDDSVSGGGGALRSLLFKLVVVSPLPFLISFRIVGFQWAEDSMSGSAPAALTSLVGSVFSVCALPPLMIFSFGISELRECCSKRHWAFIFPGLFNGMAKVFLFAGVKLVDATIASVFMQCSLLWIVFLHFGFRKRCPTTLEILGVVSIVTAAASYVLAQSTEQGPLNVGGCVLLLFGLFLDDVGGALIDFVQPSEASSLPGKLRALLMNEVMKIPGLLAVFLLFELQSVRDHGVEDVLSVPYLVGACMCAQLWVIGNNLGILISGQFLVGTAGTLSVLVTYALEVVVVRTQRLAALAVLQLVALTAVVVHVSVIEYKVLQATAEGRRAALVSIRQKMSFVPGALLSVRQDPDSASGDFGNTTTTAPSPDPIEDTEHRAMSDVEASKLGRSEGHDAEAPASWIGLTQI